MFAAAMKLVAGAGLILTVGAVTDWKAELAPVGDSGISGSATVQTALPAMADTTMPARTEFTAEVSIVGGTDGNKHPWHVHSGTCGSESAPIVGQASNYTPITIEGSGEGKAKATVSAEISPNGQYLVNIHRSPDDLTVISCGELKATGVTP